MVDEDLGDARIVYEHPEDGTVEETVENEHLAYFQDHWILKSGEEGDDDLVRRIPVQRVHYVERSVSEFEEEVATVRNRVESFADDLKDTLFGGAERTGTDGDDGPTHIDVEDGK